MRTTKSFESVITMLEAITESGMLKPERKEQAKRAITHFRRVVHSRNHRDVCRAVDEISRLIVTIIRESD